MVQGRGITGGAALVCASPSTAGASAARRRAASHDIRRFGFGLIATAALWAAFAVAFLAQLNRGTFEERLSEALKLAGPVGQTLARLFIDLDKFKEVNDFIGHPAGDRVLRAAAQRLVRCLPSSIELARWDGELGQIGSDRKVFSPEITAISSPSFVT